MQSGGRHSKLNTANMGPVQSRGQDRKSKKKRLPQADSQTQDAQKAILFCCKNTLIVVCWKRNFICSFDLLFLWAALFPFEFHTARVRPVRDHKYIFICPHLVKEWWVCTGTAEECGVELHLRFWFLRTERDLWGSLGWWGGGGVRLTRSLSFSPLSP